MQDQNEPSRGDCEQAVDQLLNHYRWRLLDRDEYVRRIWNRLRNDGSADASRAARLVYSEALYHACSGAEGAARREQGYTELFRWLYDVAYHRYGEHAERATQQALEATHASFDRSRQPDTFMLFALIRLHGAARWLERRHTAAPHTMTRAEA